MTAWLRGEPIDDVLEHVGPGLAAAPDATPIAAREWNAYAFAMGRRLLAAYARRPTTQEHVLEIGAMALATLADTEGLIALGDQGRYTVLSVEATLRPTALFSESDAMKVLLRIFRWGTRRVQQDRHLRDSLADLSVAACAAHGTLAELAGDDPMAAREVEREAQRADALDVLAGRGPPWSG
jgi:hypothetical protein